MSKKLLIVIFDDDQGMCFPMQWDDDCEGALSGRFGTGKVATFSSRVSARKAIDISAKFAALCESQGKPVNTDFSEGRKYLKIVELCLPKDFKS